MALIRPGRALFSPPPRKPVQHWSKCCFVLTPSQRLSPGLTLHPRPGHLISDGHPHPGSRLQVLLGPETGHTVAGSHLLIFSSVLVCVLSRAHQATRMVAHQAPQSMGFSRQEYWSGLPFPTPGNLPGPGIKPMSPETLALAGGFFTTEPPGKPFLVSLERR